MSIHIYNSLTKVKEELSPLDGKTVRMYACGVTVYDKCHIGHARSLYIFDVIRKYLTRYSGYKVKFVRNITDVDDKIINKAKELNKSFDEVVDENIQAYWRDLKNLGIDQADVEPRATQYIPKMITFIEGLITKDFAYETDGNVYYSVRKFGGYGKLSGQSIDQMIEATRIEQDPKKQDPLDFALWKKAKEGEKSWPSPWGEGRPGWHVECSCMSMNELESDTIDIHAGGRDLIFPHHENEIAQSEALTGQTFARHWIHHGLLTINGQKMAKSLGNFITLDKIFEKYSSDTLKLFFLQSHYSSPVDFTWEKMDNAEEMLDKFYIVLNRIAHIKQTKKLKQGQTNNIKVSFIEEKRQLFFNAMDDDFNSVKALGYLLEAISATNVNLDSYIKTHNERTGLEVIKAGEIIEELAKNVFGLILPPFKNATVTPEIATVSLSTVDAIVFTMGELPDEEENLLAERIEARKQKDFKRADELRDLLKGKGIIVEDTKEGQVWRRA